MELKEYQRKAQRTTSTTYQEDKLLNAALGLAGETGEVVDIIKKWKYQGHELDIEEIAEELGDILWYLAEMAEGIEADLGEIAANNIKKLEIRYPKCFEAERSRNREGITEKIKKLFKGPKTITQDIPTEAEITMDRAMTQLRAITMEEVSDSQKTMIEQIAAETARKHPISYPEAINLITDNMVAEARNGKNTNDIMGELIQEAHELGIEVNSILTEDVIRQIAKQHDIEILDIKIDSIKELEPMKTITVTTDTKNIPGLQTLQEKIRAIQPVEVTLVIDNKCKI